MTMRAALPVVNTLLRPSPRRRVGDLAHDRPDQAVWLGLGLVSIGVLLTIFALLVSRGQLRTGWIKLPIGKGIVHEIGFAYQAPLGTDRFTGHLEPSAAVILEDGRELGPGNADHGEIRTLGRGRLSFWGDWVYLSASDNSDPRTNGRSYVVYGPGPLSPYLAPTAGLLAAAAIVVGLWLVASAIATRSSTRSVPFTVADVCRDPVLLPLIVIACLTLAGVVIASVVLLLADPVVWLTTARARIIRSTATMLIGACGFVAGAAFTTRKVVQPLSWLVLLAPLVALVVWQPESLVPMDAAFFLQPLVLAVAVSGVILGRICHGTIVPEAPSRLFVAAVVAGAVLISLPGTLTPVVQWWNISGYMDSHMYDIDAHRIAIGEAVEGNSFVMPLYQYGMAALYYSFGHFFFVQQIANVVWLCVFVALLTLAAYELFRDVRAAALMGVVAGLTSQFRQFVKITQIENWYLPLVAAILFAWTRYRSVPTIRHAVLLALAIGLAFNCRSQGAFFFAVMCLAPLIHRDLAVRTRIVHSIVIGLIVGASLIPWSARNYVYEGRFEPSSDQASIGLLFNDHRVGFYGIRWDLYSWQAVLLEYEAKYPDKNERFAAIRRDAIANTVGSPGWWSRAFAWRTLAFYGLLPPGVWAPTGVVSTNWAQEWRGYVYVALSPLVLISLSVLGLIRRPTRDALFLAVAIFANLAVMLVASQREARISYPVLPMHFLLGLALVFPFASTAGADARRKEQPPVPVWRYTLVAFAVILVLCAVLRINVGRPNRYAPLLEPAVLQSPSALEDHRALGLRYRDIDAATLATGPAPSPNERIRVRCRLTNYMLPPKSAGFVDYLPRYASDPAREQFFYARTEDGKQYIGITYFGAIASGELRENDLVTIEGRALGGQPVPLLTIPFWVHAEAIYKQGELPTETHPGSP